MKISRVLLYGSVWAVVFVVLHMYFPWSSGVKRAIDRFLLNFLDNWWYIFPFIGLVMMLGIALYYGIHFLASFGSGYKVKTPYYTGVSILIASKNERILLERTLNSIIKSDYPKEIIQLIVITSGSTDDTTEFCKKFAAEHSGLDILILSEDIPKKG
ncbi:MAG: glycosyltransferase, partial [Promethearchaeota archaeon]